VARAPSGRPALTGVDQVDALRGRIGSQLSPGQIRRDRILEGRPHRRSSPPRDRVGISAKTGMSYVQAARLSGDRPDRDNRPRRLGKTSVRTPDRCKSSRST
jgi:hypothetical protein